MKSISFLACTFGIAALVTLASAQDKDADNSGKNERDRAAEAITPEKQSNKAEHIKLTADIRKAVVADKSLSATAKNVKIITTEDGKVTLRGIVLSAEEKTAIAAHAKKVAGEATVADHLEIKASK